MLELGDAYLANNEGGNAMSKIRKPRQMSTPTLTLAWIKIGKAHIPAPRTYDDAIAAYKKAIALEPDYALAHKNWERLLSFEKVVTWPTANSKVIRTEPGRRRCQNTVFDSFPFIRSKHMSSALQKHKVCSLTTP